MHYRQKQAHHHTNNIQYKYSKNYSKSIACGQELSDPTDSKGLQRLFKLTPPLLDQPRDILSVQGSRALLLILYLLNSFLTTSSSADSWALTSSVLSIWHRMKTQGKKLKLGVIKCDGKLVLWVPCFLLFLTIDITDRARLCGFQIWFIRALAVLSLARVINFKFSLQPHQKYYITQYEEL